MAETLPALTAGERIALLRHWKAGYYGSADHGWGGSARDPASFCRAGRSLMDKGLIEWHPDRKDSRTALTPRGRDIRARLLKENPNG